MVSVILTNYNYDKYIPETLKSVTASCANAKTEYEVILVNDNPKTSVNFGLKNDKNMGVSFSRNRGIKKSAGEFIVILDGDDMLTPDSITNQLKVMEDESVDIVHGPVYRFEGDLTYDQVKKGRFKKHPSLITCQGMMVRRRVFEKFGLYFEGLRSAEDKEMLFRWGMHRNSPLKKIVKDVRIKYPVAYYRRHPDSKRKKRKYDRDFDIKTMMAFDARIMSMILHGITKGVELLPPRNNV